MLTFPLAKTNLLIPFIFLTFTLFIVVSVFAQEDLQEGEIHLGSYGKFFNYRIQTKQTLVFNLTHLFTTSKGIFAHRNVARKVIATIGVKQNTQLQTCQE